MKKNNSRILLFLSLVFFIFILFPAHRVYARVSPCPPVGDVELPLINEITQADADLVNTSKDSFNSVQKLSADVSGDGIIDNKDSDLIGKYAAGTINTFPICDLEVPEACPPLGDVDENKKVNIVDALFIAQYTVNSRTLTSQQLKNADVNFDNSVNIVDALFIAQYTVEQRRFEGCPETPVVSTGGLVPCGRINNDSNTSWDDTAPCNLCFGFLMLQNIVNWLAQIAVGIAVFILVIAGLFYVFSSGDPGKIELAKSAISYALIGLALVFIAWLLTGIIIAALGYSHPFSGGSWNIVDCPIS